MIPEKAIASAPSTAASRGRATTAASGVTIRGPGAGAWRPTGIRGLRAPVTRGQRFSGIPTKRSPSSWYWSSSGAEGASSIRSEPDWVLGKAMTSRMFVW